MFPYGYGGGWGGYAPTPPRGTPALKGHQGKWVDAKVAKALEKPDPTTPEGWVKIHRGHGKEPYYETKVGIYHWWRCPSCHDKFTFTDEDIAKAPERYSSLPRQ